MSLINWPAAIGFMLYGMGLIGVVFWPAPGEDALG